MGYCFAATPSQPPFFAQPKLSFLAPLGYNQAMSPSTATHLTGAELDEFKRTALAENLRRFSAILLITIVLNLFTLVAERQVFGPEANITAIRIIEIAASLLYLVVIGRSGKRPYHFQKGLFLFTVSLGLFLSAVISAQMSSTQGSTVIFLVGMLVISTFLILPLPEILGVMALGLIYQGVAILLSPGANRAIAQPGNIINVTTMTLLALTIAHMSYNARRQRFAYELVIRQHNQFLQTIAALDGLTGVPNRRKVDETAATIQAFAARDRAPVAVVMLDLDNFKAYNDTRGHLAGDELLKAAAVAMQSVLQRDSDFFGRYGGEEFIAILPFTEAAGAALLADQMRQAVFDLGMPHPGSVAGVVTVSGGVAVGVPSAEAGIEAIIHRADQALYRAKQAGRNRIEIHLLASEIAGVPSLKSQEASPESTPPA